MAMSVLFSFYLFSQLHSKESVRTEAFNEITTLFLIYLLMCFSDFISDPELRNKLGYVYIGVIFTNISAHLLVLIYTNIKAVKLSIRKRIHKFRSRKAPNPTVPIEV